MADGTYSPKVYRKQGGDEIVVADDGIIRVESGGSILMESGGFIGPSTATGPAASIAQTTTTAVAISATGVSIINAILTALAGARILTAT